MTLFFTTSEEIMLGRLLERGKTSGREDDNVESIKKRFRTYKSDTMPVIEYYASLSKVAEVGNGFVLIVVLLCSSMFRLTALLPSTMYIKSPAKRFRRSSRKSMELRFDR